MTSTSQTVPGTSDLAGSGPETRAPNDIDLIVSDVFRTMMRMEVEPTEARWAEQTNRVTASVHVAGSWNGAVMLETSAEQACFFTGQFLSLLPPPQVNDDVRDVMCEVVNMIGGNFKNTFARGAMLSLPAVVDGGSYRMKLTQWEATERFAYNSEVGVFWVIVYRLL